MLAKRNHFLSFQKRVIQGDDGYGNELTEFVEQFRTRGAITRLRGGEDVIASRLQGEQTLVMRVLQSRDVDNVCPDWRVVEYKTGKTYNVRSVEPTEDGKWVDILMQSGVADG